MAFKRRAASRTYGKRKKTYRKKSYARKKTRGLRGRGKDVIHWTRGVGRTVIIRPPAHQKIAPSKKQEESAWKIWREYADAGVGIGANVALAIMAGAGLDWPQTQAFLRTATVLGPAVHHVGAEVGEWLDEQPKEHFLKQPKLRGGPLAKPILARQESEKPFKFPKEKHKFLPIPYQLPEADEMTDRELQDWNQDLGLLSSRNLDRYLEIQKEKKAVAAQGSAKRRAYERLVGRDPRNNADTDPFFNQKQTLRVDSGHVPSYEDDLGDYKHLHGCGDYFGQDRRSMVTTNLMDIIKKGNRARHAANMAGVPTGNPMPKQYSKGGSGAGGTWDDTPSTTIQPPLNEPPPGWNYADWHQSPGLYVPPGAQAVVNPGGGVSYVNPPDVMAGPWNQIRPDPATTATPTEPTPTQPNATRNPNQAFVDWMNSRPPDNTDVGTLMDWINRNPNNYYSSQSYDPWSSFFQDYRGGH